MVNPSDTYSDIGDFQGGEAGWWFGKPEADHPGLQQKLTELGVEIIHRGTTPPEQSEYAPEASAAYYNETSEVLHLGDGTAWNAQATWGANPTFESIEAGSQSTTGDIVSAHGSNGNFTESYLISDYTDVLDACQQAHDDMPDTGGTVVMPHGTFQASTQLHIWKTFSLKTAGGFSSRFGQDRLAASTRIVWNGGTTTAILVKPTANTPTPSLAGVEIGAISLEPATNGGGDRAIHVETTTDSAVRNVLFDKTRVLFWGGSNPACHLDGNTFSVYANRFRGASNECTAFGVTSPADPASEHYFYCPEFFSTKGNWAVELDTNTWSIFGGAFQHLQGTGTTAGGHGLDVHGAGHGGIWGTKFEGHQNEGIAIRLSGPSEWSHIQPNHVAKYDTGVQVGNTTTNQNTTNVTIDTHFNKNVIEDIKVEGGGQRENLRILCPTPGGITDNRNLQATDAAMYNGRGQGEVATANAAQRPSPGSREPGLGTLFSSQFDGATAATQDKYMAWEDGSYWYTLSPMWGSYTGDGTTGLTVDLNIRPAMAVISDGSSSVMCIRPGGGTIIPMHGQTSIGGSISFTDTGFTVADGGSDSFPNTTGTSYYYYIQ